jgi:hypothetical protein
LTATLTPRGQTTRYLQRYLIEKNPTLAAECCLRVAAVSLAAIELPEGKGVVERQGIQLPGDVVFAGIGTS